MIHSNADYTSSNLLELIVHVDEAVVRLDELIDRTIAGEKVVIALDDEYLVQLVPILDE